MASGKLQHTIGKILCIRLDGRARHHDGKFIVSAGRERYDVQACRPKSEIPATIGCAPLCSKAIAIAQLGLGLARNAEASENERFEDAPIPFPGDSYAATENADISEDKENG